MSNLAQAISNQAAVHADKANQTVTTNGMAAFRSTFDANLDFFGRAGNVKYPSLISDFAKAFAEDSETALRNLLHMRDIRGDTGGYRVRDNSRKVLVWLLENHPAIFLTTRLIQAIPTVGRWDDLFVLVDDNKNKTVSNAVIKFIAEEFKKEVPNGLLCKWLPRTGPVASKLRSYLKLTPKEYRKRLVQFRNVVETKMCNKEWSNIKFEHVPSQASKIYRKAFLRHEPLRYTNFIEAATKGEVKINASTLYPHEVLGPRYYDSYADATKEALWKNLPDYIGEGLSFLPVVDVSGSMTTTAYGNYSCMDIAVALGIYTAQRNKSAFKDLFVTFSSRPEFVKLNPEHSVATSLHKMVRSNWDMSTNVMSVFELILELAVKEKVHQEDLPSSILIFSDMQFNCVRDGENVTALEAIKAKFKAAGYEAPSIVFWNLNSRYANLPVTRSSTGACLVSGSSPAIVKAVLSGRDVTPLSTMQFALGSDRYDIL